MKKAQKQESQSLLAVVLGAMTGSVLAFFGIQWVVGGRIEYWTGPSERHHFLASPDSTPGVYWMLVLVFCVGAILLGAKSMVALIAWLRFRSEGRRHGAGTDAAT